VDGCRGWQSVGAVGSQRARVAGRMRIFDRMDRIDRIAERSGVALGKGHRGRWASKLRVAG